MAARLPANAAEYSALCALGHRYRGRLEAMTAALQEAFRSDPSCPQAHLIAGEVAQMTADRLTGEAHLEACHQAKHHHSKVWEGAGTAELTPVTSATGLTPAEENPHRMC